MIRIRNVRLNSLWGLALWLGVTASCFAQVPPPGSANLGIEVQISVPNPIPPGSSAVVTVTVRNSSLVDSALAQIYTLDPAHYAGGAFTLTPSPPNACPTQFWEPSPPTTPPTRFLRSDAGNPAAGELRQCTYLLAASPQASGSYLIRLRVAEDGVNMPDPNPANDLANLLVAFGAPVTLRTIPTTGTLALLALLLGIGVLGAWRRR
jgi:hypothetical protein